MTSIVFFGTPQFSATILQKLIDANFKPSLVITAPDRPIGRHGTTSPTPVKSLAKLAGIPIKTYGSLRNRPDVEEEIKKHQPDLIIVAAYGKIIPENILRIPKIYPINVHGSILPKLRGASPVQYAILQGLKETGVTLMVMNEKMDEGDILKTTSIPIDKNETSQTLFNKMSNIAADFLVKSLPEIISGKIKPKTQDHKQATYTKLINKTDGEFNYRKPPKNLNNMVRAFYPWPGVFTQIDGQVIKLLPEGKIQLPNRKAISLRDFQNSYRNISEKLSETFKLLQKS